MKPYKIDLSGFTGKVREVVRGVLFEHGLYLGYRYIGDREDIKYAVALNFDSDGRITYHSKIDSYFGYPNIEIAADAFLALTTAKDEPSFKPFDRVLVRHEDHAVWRCSHYSHAAEGGVFVTASGYWNQCIPYEGNEALLGTTDSPE